MTKENSSQSMYKTVPAFIISPSSIVWLMLQSKTFFQHLFVHLLFHARWKKINIELLHVCRSLLYMDKEQAGSIFSVCGWVMFLQLMTSMLSSPGLYVWGVQRHVNWNIWVQCSNKSVVVTVSVCNNWLSNAALLPAPLNRKHSPACKPL